MPDISVLPLSWLDTQLGISRTSSRQTIAITIGSPHGITCSGASYAIRKRWKKPSKSSRGYVTSINWSAILTVRRFFSSSVWKQFSFFNIWLTSKREASTSPAAAIVELGRQHSTMLRIARFGPSCRHPAFNFDWSHAIDNCQAVISRSQASVLGWVEGQETVMHQTCHIFISPSGAHTCLTSFQNSIMRLFACLGQLFRLWWKQKGACFRLHHCTGKSYMYGIQLASLTWMFRTCLASRGIYIYIYIYIYPT